MWGTAQPQAILDPAGEQLSSPQGLSHPKEARRQQLEKIPVFSLSTPQNLVKKISSGAKKVRPTFSLSI